MRNSKASKKPESAPSSKSATAKSQTRAVKALKTVAADTAKRLAQNIPSVRLELYAPGARQVAVAGSFNNWTPSEMVLSSIPGKWMQELTLPPGPYEYLFQVDGQWTPDPQAQALVPNPYGGQNSLVIVPVA